MSDEELKDFEDARDTLNHYEIIYSLIEYTTQLHETNPSLELRMMSNNPTIAMNIYRKSKANSREALFSEMEALLQAYYNLMDDCKDYPLWERKFQEDLGGSVSFLGIQMEEALRDNIVATSPVFARFDGEKQVYFK